MIIWKDILGYEGCYKISNTGLVKSLERKVNSNGGIRIVKEKILKQSENKYGYPFVILTKNDKRKTIHTHKLVAIAFLGHKPDGTNKLVVDHINNIKTDNRLENLQIITNRENSSKDKKNKTSKYTGVFWNTTYKTWTSRIQIKGKRKHIGNFDCETSAHLAYQKELKDVRF